MSMRSGYKNLSLRMTKQHHLAVTLMTDFSLLYNINVPVMQWITYCHKNHMTTRVITFWRIHVASLKTAVSTMLFLNELMFILEQNFTMT